MLSAPILIAWIMSVRYQGQEVISDEWHDDGCWMSQNDRASLSHNSYYDLALTDALTAVSQ